VSYSCKLLHFKYSRISNTRRRDDTVSVTISIEVVYLRYGRSKRIGMLCLGWPLAFAAGAFKMEETLLNSRKEHPN
jgi:hypothetical protein